MGKQTSDDRVGRIMMIGLLLVAVIAVWVYFGLPSIRFITGGD